MIKILENKNLHQFLKKSICSIILIIKIIPKKTKNTLENELINSLNKYLLYVFIKF